MREGYQQMLGEKGGDVAYSAVDVAASGYGLLRPVLKEGSWKLFRYTSDQYQPAALSATVPQAGVELAGLVNDANSAAQAVQAVKAAEEKKE